MSIPDNWTMADKRKEANAAARWLRRCGMAYHEGDNTHMGQWHAQEAARYDAAADLLDIAFAESAEPPQTTVETG